MAKTPEFDLREDYGRNYIINGNFDFWQRGTFFNSNVYTADRWLRAKTAPPAWEWTRETDVPTVDESGFQSQYSLKMDTTASPGSVAAGETVGAIYRVEGSDFATLHNKNIVLSFWTKSSKPGTYAVSIRNAAFDRSYVAEYTIDVANTWEKKEIVIKHDNTGTWNIGNGIGAHVTFDYGSGTNFQTTAGSWQSGNFTSTANVDNILDSIANEVFIAQVQLMEGTQSLPFRRAGKTIGEEFSLCLRYYEQAGDFAETTPILGRQRNFSGGAVDLLKHYPFKVEKRAIPTVIYRSDINDGGSSNNTVTYYATEKGWTQNPSVPAGGFLDISAWSADAEL